jgi:dihydroorotate dehydrogenase electron transfer subunit
MPSVIDAPIVVHCEVAPRHYTLTLHAPPIAEAAQPGQFVQVRGADWMDPLLPRPFSVMRTHRDTGNIEILYRVVGKGTELMASWRVGETVQVVGPLGNGFRISDFGFRILVGGGVGVPPMVMLAEQLQKAEGRRQNAVIVLQGARTAEQLLCVEDFQRLGVELRLATDDGSRGHHGLVTDLLQSAIRNPQSAMIYTCGPHAMMREVARLCDAHGVPCQAALEAPMPCGFGVCMGCVVKTTDGRYRRVCKEGSVFDANEVVWE